MRSTTIWFCGACSVVFIYAPSVALPATIAYARFDHDLGVSAGSTPGAGAIVDETGLHVSVPGVHVGAPTTNGEDLRWASSVPGPLIPQIGQPNSFSLSKDGAMNSWDGFEMPGADFSRGTGAWTIEHFAMLDPTQPINGVQVGFFGFNRVQAMVHTTGDLNRRMRIFIDQGVDVLDHAIVLGPADGLWHHYAWVHPADSGQVDMYYDGQLVGSLLAGSLVDVDLGSNPRMSVILEHSPSVSPHLTIDEVRVSDTALVPAQLLSAVPEPSTLALAGIGLAGMLWCAARRRTRRTALNSVSKG